MKRLLILIVLLVSGNQLAFGEIQYKEILFPEGLPSKIVDGVEQEALLKIHSIKPVLKNGFILLYSTIQDSGWGNGKLFSVYLSLIEIKAHKPQVISTTNITNYLKTYEELPGVFKRMDALMESFKISDNRLGIHVNLWSIISGSGSLSSSTDLFYSIASDLKIELTLAIVKSSHFSKLGNNIFNAKNSYLYHGDIDADNIPELFVLETKYNVDQINSINTFSLSPDIVVYKFDGESYNSFKTFNVFTEKIGPLKPFNASNQIIFSNIPKKLNTLFCKQEAEDQP